MLTNINNSVLSVSAAISGLKIAQAAAAAVTPAATPPASGATTGVYTAGTKIGIDANESGTYNGTLLTGGANGTVYVEWTNTLTGVDKLLPLGQVPSFAVGTNYVPYDMTAQIHEGERIIPKADNYKLTQGNEAMLEELRLMRIEIAGLRAQAGMIVVTSKKTADIVEKADAIGPAPARAAA